MAPAPDINSSTVTPVSFSVYLNYAKHTSASGPLHFILLYLKCSLTFFISLLKLLSQIAHFPPAAFFFLALITIQHSYFNCFPKYGRPLLSVLFTAVFPVARTVPGTEKVLHKYLNDYQQQPCKGLLSHSVDKES